MTISSAASELHTAPPPTDGCRHPPIARLILLAVMVVATAVALVLNRPPAPRDEAASPMEFSAIRALAHLRSIAVAPRPVGSEAHREAREYILRALRSQGLDPEVQSVDVAASAWGRPVPGGVVRNLVATLPGTERGPAVLLVSHYDSVPNGPGASDDGAAVVAMLETLRALRAGPPLKNDIVFLFTDAEELGLVGAQAFADHHPLIHRIGVALNFEARGSRGPVLMFETSEDSGWLIDELAAAAPSVMANSLSVEVYRRMPNNTDFAVFRQKGISGMNFAYLGGYRHYHAEGDTIENIELGSLQHHGSYMLSLARRLGDADLRHTRRRDAIYFNPVGDRFMHYSSVWALPLVAVAWAAVLGAVAYGSSRGRLRVARAAAGLGALFGNVLVTVAVVLSAWSAVSALDPRFQPDAGRPEYGNAAYMLGFYALTVAIGAGVAAFAARWASPLELGAGAVFGWLLLATAAAIGLPGASFVFTWPVLYGSLGLLALLFSREAGAVSLREAALLAVSAALSLFLLVPMIEGIYTALALPASAIVMAVVALLLGLLSPQLAVIVGRRRNA